MSKHTPKDTFLDRILETPLDQALSERYLAYALSTITARSLPDARDGLKPVHRRLLYAMRLLKLDPKSGFKKCARIVGDVMGKFHPHGDQAIYDALVRLAQEFAQRYPLVDGQGNFGNVDGDNAAAMRYTEARLTEVAELLLEGLDEDTVDFRSTYDGEDDEPIVLPAAFPNLLANGASGIAVGMATNIPPHNVGELCDAFIHIIRHPNVTAAKLAELVPGPDFPTGGLLIEPRESITESYKTGRGSFRLRARWSVEELGRGAWRILVTEIPYQVQKSKLIEKIAQLIGEKKLPLLDDVRDESSSDIRLVLEPKNRTTDPELLMESLFKATDLEIRFALNLNVLDKGKPRVMGLRDALQAFLDHRHEVLLRKSQNRLSKIEDRLEILAGLLIAYLNLDAIIRIIREEDEPKPVMMKRFGLSDVQAEAILNTRLRALRRLEEIAIKTEHEALEKERRELKKLLGDEALRWARISEELADLKKRFGSKSELGRRRTGFADAPAVADIAPEMLVEREPITVVCSQKGWIRVMKGHGVDPAGLSYKDGDKSRFVIPCETTDKLILFATNGRAYTLAPDKLPGGRGHGEPVRLMFDLGDDQDLVALFAHTPGAKRILASYDGRGFVVPEDEMLAQTRNGKQILSLDAGIEAVACAPVSGDALAVIGENRKLLIFKLSDLPEMAKGKGVRLQRYKDGGLRDLRCFTLKNGLRWTDASGREKSETAIKEWVGERGQAGRMPPKGFNKSGKFTA